LYASVTDYAAVYDDNYRRRRGDHTSFDREVLPPLISSFCHNAGISKLLDVSGGRGGLGAALREDGINAFTTDFGAVPEVGVVPFDLSSYSTNQTENVLKTVRSDSAAYVTTCFDVLEHIDKEHVAAAIRNLTDLSDRVLIVSISTRPSAFDNLLHATLAPVQTWLAAFEAAGFRLRPSEMFEPATSKRTFPQTHDLRLVNRWTAADLLDDVSVGEPRYFVLEKENTDLDWATVVEKIDTLFDVAYRAIKRKHFSLGAHERINFNLHHEQEWSIVRPLLDILPRKQVRFFIRPDAFNSDTLRAVRSFLRRSGVETLDFKDIRELPWQDIKGEILISGAESNVGSGHLLSQELVAVARVHGCRTYLLQHGIWPRPYDERIVTFASEHVITWGREEEARLNRQRPFFGTSAPWGIVRDGQVHTIGSAKYADQLIQPYSPVHALFGFDPSAFNKIVLVGTKNLRGRWGINNINDAFLGELAQLVTSHPDTMFIIRPHPIDSAELFGSLRRPNVRLFDELCGILADIPLSRVIPGVDYLVTSPSTMILDGAVSSKPTYVYTTGQPHELDGIDPGPLSKFSDLLRAPVRSDLARTASRFKEKFGDAIGSDFYGRFSELLSVTGCEEKLDITTASVASLATQAVSLQRSQQALQAHVEALEVKCAEHQAHAQATEAKSVQYQEDFARLSSVLDATRQELSSERDRNRTLMATVHSTESSLEKLIAERDTLTMSKSWRYTSPVRRVLGALARMRGAPRNSN
jgi:hypothetical protein